MHSSQTMDERAIDELVEQAVSTLVRDHTRLVLAESCTAGLACAWLGRRPGVSEYLCGSSVTYRDLTKEAWLNVRHDLLAAWSAVSQPASDAMACGVLSHTPEATLAVAVTGHLGPDAPSESDGWIFLSAAQWHEGLPAVFQTQRLQLASSRRTDRQAEAACQVLRFVRDLSGGPARRR